MSALGFLTFGHSPTSAALDLNVLIADDDPQVTSVLEAFLRRRGCRPFFATDGTVALRYLAMSSDPTWNLGRIDVVIADADLPGRSGIDILVTARDCQWDVAIVLTSVSADPGSCSELQRLGAAAVLTKPVSLSQLDGALAQIAVNRAPG